MPKDFYSLLLNTYKDIEYKDFSFYLEKKKKENISSLDYYAREFLSLFYKVEILSKEDLVYYLALWKYEALLYNLYFTKEKTEFYKDIEIKANINIVELIHAFETKKIFKEHTLEELNALYDDLIEKIPFITSADLERDSEAFLAINSREILGVSSLDASGKVFHIKDDEALKEKQKESRKKRIYYSAIDLSSMLNFIFFGMQDIVKQKDARILLMMSPGKAKTAGVLFCATMQRLGLECKVITFSSDYHQVANDVLEYRANILFGVPWNLHALSVYMKNKNIQHEIRAVILNGDTASVYMREELAHNLDCEVFLHYGMTEVGFGGAVECLYHEAMHLRMLDISIEVVDENLQKVEDGVVGEIVVTTLTRNAIPLIRYRTGDRGRIIPQECQCGSAMQRVEVLGFFYQGISLNEEKFIHLSSFQDFFYRTFKKDIENDESVDIKQPAILDFEIGVFKDEEKQKKCLLIGVHLSNILEKNILLPALKKSFARHFELTAIENVKAANAKNREDISENIEAFYICDRDEFESIFKRNAEKQLRNGEDFENIQELDKAFALSVSKLNSFTAAKKNIVEFSGKLFKEE